MGASIRDHARIPYNLRMFTPSPLAAPRVLRLGHSPDPDDAFMWYPLADFAPDDPKSPGGKRWSPRIDTAGYKFVHVLEDIQSLNQRSAGGDPAQMLEITALSIHQYPYVADRYALTSCRSSMGDGYGPMVITRAGRKLRIEDLAGTTIAVPGERTSAFLALSLLMGRRVPRYEVVMFDQIIAAVAAGRFEAGLIIHEGQLTYAQAGLEKVVDLGQWWKASTGLPLPLGGNAIKRDLPGGRAEMRRVCRVLLESIRYALAHREEAVAYALNYARDMGGDLADRFVGMYVNEWTLDYGPAGRRAVNEFLRRAAELKLVPAVGDIDFIDPA